LDRQFGPFGLTASEFVDDCRVILAAALLEHSDWTVDRAAQEAGCKVRALRSVMKERVGCQLRDLKAAGSTERAGRAIASHIVACAAHPRIEKARPKPWLDGAG
jgi:AraC-like DNA-binding protein